MVHILLDILDFSADFLSAELRRFIRPEHKVAILAFSYRDSAVHCLKEWNALYEKEGGLYYDAMVTPFLHYGIPESHIRIINYYSDTPSQAAELLRQADIIYLPGGLPHRMLERIDDFGLRNTLLSFQGIMMGYSAGALLQLQEYHLSPDEDYPEFCYHSGLPLLKDFYLEVHYQGTDVQNQAIQRVLSERRKTVYATVTDRSAILVDGSEIKLLGDVRVFTPSSQ